MVMTARWKRIAEYWPPFAVMFSAFALQPWLRGARSSLTGLPTDMLDELQPYLDRTQSAVLTKEDKTRALWRAIGVALVAISLGTVLVLNFYVTSRDIASSEPHDYFRAGA